MKKRLVFAVIGIVLAAALFVSGCEMSTGDPIRFIPIVDPYISEQPQSYAYLDVTYNFLKTLIPHELKVEVSDWRGADGVLEYQWYQFDSFEDYCEPVKDDANQPVFNDDGTPKVKGGTPIQGATEPTYTPTLEASETDSELPKVKTYYYYCVVTNYFQDASTYDENGNRRPAPTRASIQSEVSVISISAGTINANTGAASGVYAPVLTKQPRSASYPMGRSVAVAPLEVSAEIALRPGPPSNMAALQDAQGGVSYKWYANDTFSVTGGTAIPNANGSTYTPDLAALSKGPNYFYVEVSNIYGSTTITIPCLPVAIIMVPSDKAANPKITTQSGDQLVLGSDAVQALSITAVSPDGTAANLSYQWYSLDIPAATATGNQDDRVVTEPKRTKIETNGTSATYTPTVASGSAYFQVDITNTNPDATKQTTATISSKVITVTRGTAASATTANATITIPDGYNTVNDASRMQYIRGFGSMEVAWANFPETYESDTHLMHNPDWGFGFNMLRIMVVPPGSTAGNFTDHAHLITAGTPGGPEPDGSSPNGGIMAQHRPNYIKNVKIVNDYGGYVFASPWTPPKEWKSNNSINSGGYLLKQYYPAFASYLRQFAQFMYYQGAPIYAISIANEPNYAGGYDGCEWTADEMMEFWKQVGRFTEGVRGFGGGKSIPTVLTLNGESANTPGINGATLADPVSRAAVDLYARHVYGSQTSTLWGTYASYKEGPIEKECWMTEHNINSATPTAFPNDWTWNYVWRFMNDVDLVIRLNNENAFVWWAGKRFYSFVGDGAANTTNGGALPRGWGLSHFAKYTIDTRRIDLKGDAIKGKTASGASQADIVNGGEDSNVNPSNFGLDTTGAKITAYVSKDGSEISLVMFTPTLTDGNGGTDMGTIQINMPDGFLIGSVKAQRSTSGGNYLVKEDVPIASDRKSAFVTLPAGNILSVKFTKQ